MTSTLIQVKYFVALKMRKLFSSNDLDLFNDVLNEISSSSEMVALVLSITSRHISTFETNLQAVLDTETEDNINSIHNALQIIENDLLNSNSGGGSGGNDDIISGNKSVNWRFSNSTQFGAFALTSTRKSITSSNFFCNEYGIPTSGSNLDITFPTSAATLGIASTSTSDTLVGTGAQIILVEGLDSNYDAISESIELSGQTEVNSTLLFLRVNVATVIQFGSTGYNEGTIYIGGSANIFTNGIPQTDVYRTIGVDDLDNIGINLSAPSTYTIARNFEGVPLNFKVATNATDAKPLLVRGIFKPFGLPELIGGNLVFNGSDQFTFDGFPVFAEKTDIIIRTRADSTTVGQATVFWEWNIRDTTI